MKTRTKSNSTVILDRMIERGLSAQQAAREAKISNDVFCSLIRSDRHVSYRTAGKLRQMFGSDAVVITEPLPQL